MAVITVGYNRKGAIPTICPDIAESHGECATARDFLLTHPMGRRQEL
jgi:hypothetical protein